MIHKVFVAFSVLAATIANAHVVAGQAFVNLDFQAANLSNEFSASGVFPGWSFVPALSVSYLQPHLSNLPHRHLYDNVGDFALRMQAGEVPTNPEWTAFESSPITISQTGLVPFGTKSIRLDAPTQHPFFPESDPNVHGEKSWRLLMNGLEIEMIDLGGGVWGGNIPNLANQIGTLAVTMDKDYFVALPGPYRDMAEFDNIQFSTQLIPEPTTLCLAAIAGTAMLRRGRRLNGV